MTLVALRAPRRLRLEGLDGVGREVARRTLARLQRAARARRADPAAVTRAAREIATALDAELIDLGRRAFSMLEIPRGAPGDRQAGRPPQLPHQLHPEPVEARRRGGLPVRHDGRRAGPRSQARPAGRADARHRQGAHPRARRLARRHRRRLRAPPGRGRGRWPTPSAPTTPTSRSTAPTPTWWRPPTRCRAAPGRAPPDRRELPVAHRGSRADHPRLPRRRRGVRRAGRARGAHLRRGGPRRRSGRREPVERDRRRRSPQEMRFPGQIRVTVIRELKAVEVAS